MSLQGTAGSFSGATDSQTVQYPPYRGLRYEEEHALEKMISGLTVPNAQNQPLPVKVFWKDPQRELNRITYPHMMLEFLDMTLRRNEEVRGIVEYGMEPYTGNYLPGGGHVNGEFPLPCMLHYQCSVYSRVQVHDIILNDICATTFFPIRYGQLNTASGTARRLDLESMVSRDHLDPNDKRLYCKVWTFAISAEIVPAQWAAATPVTQIDISVDDGVPTGPQDASIIISP